MLLARPTATRQRSRGHSRPAPAPAAKPTRKRKAQQDAVEANAIRAQSAEANGGRLGKQAKKLAAADAAAAAAAASTGAEAQQRRKKQKPAAKAAAAAPSKQHAAPAVHHIKAQQKGKPVRAVEDAGGEVPDAAAANATSSDEPPLQREYAALEQPAAPPRPVRQSPGLHGFGVILHRRLQRLLSVAD